MKKGIFLKYTALIAVLGAAFTVQPAKADFLFDLTAGNSAISGFPGPYAQVDVNRTSATTATITFTSLTNSGNIYLLGDGGSVDVNVNATTFTLGAITGSNAGTGFTPGPYSNSGSGNVDGFGVFNQTITSFDGFTHSSDTISFSLTNTSGTWATANSVLTANANGALAGAHIFITSSPANAANGAIATGFAAGPGTPQNTPDGGTTAMLLGSALAGLGAMRRYLKR
jgi:VPDSG-CTERM motif